MTNPAIDPLREGLVMSLEVNIGKRRNILDIGPENASQVGKLSSFVLRSNFICFRYQRLLLSQFDLLMCSNCLLNVDQVTLSSPVLNEGELESLLKDPYLKAQVLPTFFDIRKGVDGSLEKILNRLCDAADEAVRNGSQLLVLSDRSEELVRTILGFICISKTLSI